MRIRVFDETLPDGGVGCGLALAVEVAGGGGDHLTTTLRELIRSRVQQEVERYNQHPGGVFEGLVPPDEREGILNGRRTDTLDWETQCRKAFSSFERNGFLVLVDDQQVTDLDAPLQLRADSKVSFVKLTPLIGG